MSLVVVEKACASLEVLPDVPLVPPIGAGGATVASGVTGGRGFGLDRPVADESA